MKTCLVACFIVIITFVGCKKFDDEGKMVFRYNESSGITSLDPAFARNQANIWGINQLFNGLVQLNDKLQVIPCIAKSWEISDGGRRYTFHLRQDVFFHDDPLFIGGKGRKVVAADFLYSFSRIVDTLLASPGAWVFNSVKKDRHHFAFNALNDSTFIIELSQPFPPFPGLLSMQYCSVVPKEVVEKYGKDFRKHPVGTGPFQLKLWKEGVKLVMIKNPNYFESENGKRLPYLDAVAVTFIVDKQSVFLEFVKGNLDFMSGLDASYKDELLTRQGGLNTKYKGRFRMLAQPYLNTEYLGFLVDTTIEKARNSPLAKKEIRQAINYGFDRKKMMKFLRNNVGYPGMYGFIPPGLPSFDSIKVTGYNYNPLKARELMAKAGFPEGKGLPEIYLFTNSSYLDLATYIQQQLNELGFNIKMDVHPPASMREMIAQSKLPFFRGSWIADYPDAENYLSLFYSPNFAPKGPNYTHFSSKVFDELYQKAINEVNDSLRYQYYQQMDQLIMDEAPVVVLYYDQVLRFIRNNVQGLGSNAMNLLTLKRVRKI
ncbi:MAG: ABC transporter substrate-binding protein [Bacteroidetes bacterium]|nr:ABC transporter substrate-binding protein [Bacteroidota bacterium]